MSQPQVNLTAGASPPFWAVEFAASSLGAGLQVQEIERELVSRGLPPAVATAAVDAALEERVRARFTEFPPLDRVTLAHRIASTVVFAIDMILFFRAGVLLGIVDLFIVLLFPLGCVWFAERMASDRRTPDEIANPNPATGRRLRVGGLFILVVTGMIGILLNCIQPS